MAHARAGRSGASTPASTTSSRGCASRAGCPKPRLYVVDDPAPNAFSTGRNPKHAAVAVTTGLLEKMNRVELEGVLAHELSHIRNYDVLVMTLAVTMVGIIALISDFFLRIMFWTGGRGGRDDNNSNNPLGIVFAILGFVLLIFAPIIAALMQMAVSRNREYLADASGVQLTRYPPGLISALEKLKDDHTVDALRVEGDRAPVDRGAARQGVEQGRHQVEPPVRHAPADRRPDPRPRADVTRS